MNLKYFIFFWLFVAKIPAAYTQVPSVGIQYIVSVNTDDIVMRTKEIYSLVIVKNESIYYNHLIDSMSDFPHKAILAQPKKIGIGTKVKLSDNHTTVIAQDVLYKNYEQDSIIYNAELMHTGRFELVGESLQLFDWHILPNSDTLILGYKCQAAKADFRGRTYTAYFSPQLHAFGGPWKFDGLPGLILQVQCHEKFFVIEPYKIVLNATLDPIKNPYRELSKETLNREQYIYVFGQGRLDYYKFIKAGLAKYLPDTPLPFSFLSDKRIEDDMEGEDITDSSLKGIEERLKKTAERLNMGKKDNKKK